ncbi:MAG TPA: hypothetical protein VFF78_08795, partial [Anaerolineaceae bacterium]|nr:hypothetical protein [Anaerolineaceae bacterium]
MKRVLFILLVSGLLVGLCACLPRMENLKTPTLPFRLPATPTRRVSPTLTRTPTLTPTSSPVPSP